MFIEWIEIDRICRVLTDGDIFSMKGVFLRKKYPYEEIFSAKAILEYFEIDPDHYVKIRRQPDFWLADTLPPAIAEKIASFDRYWGESWRCGMFDNQLLYILRRAPYKWREKAVDRILRMEHPPIALLAQLIATEPDVIREAAMGRLQTQQSAAIPFEQLEVALLQAPEDWAQAVFAFYFASAAPDEVTATARILQKGAANLQWRAWNRLDTGNRETTTALLNRDIPPSWREKILRAQHDKD